MMVSNKLRITGSFITMLSSVIITTTTLAADSIADPTAGRSDIPSDRETRPGLLTGFLALADVASGALREEPMRDDNDGREPRLRAHIQNFIDSYGVRALAVAYDLTGRERYLAACRTWSDRMLSYQSKMVPEGAYYMGYHRKPGETTGQWFVADCCSIAMGILATALRCDDEIERERYLSSLGSFAGLVMDNFVRDSGGITDGYWEKSDEEWWCSTSLFAAFAFQMFGVTGEERYRRVALGAVDWMLRFQYNQTILYPFEKGAPTTVFYVLESYAASLPHLDPGSQRRQEVFTRFSQAVEWIVRNQDRDGWWDYDPGNWGVKLNGLPCHLLIYLRSVEDTRRRESESIDDTGELLSFESIVSKSVDRAFRHLITSGPAKDRFTQQGAFAMMSCAERFCPGELYHKKDTGFPYERYTEEELSRLRSE